MRIQPNDAVKYEWKAFEVWAEENGIGEDIEDYGIWWDCWKAGYDAAENFRRRAYL